MTTRSFRKWWAALLSLTLIFFVCQANAQGIRARLLGDGTGQFSGNGSSGAVGLGGALESDDIYVAIVLRAGTQQGTLSDPDEMAHFLLAPAGAAAGGSIFFDWHPKRIFPRSSVENSGPYELRLGLQAHVQVGGTSWSAPLSPTTGAICSPSPTVPCGVTHDIVAFTLGIGPTLPLTIRLNDRTDSGANILTFSLTPRFFLLAAGGADVDVHFFDTAMRQEVGRSTTPVMMGGDIAFNASLGQLALGLTVSYLVGDMPGVSDLRLLAGVTVHGDMVMTQPQRAPQAPVNPLAPLVTPPPPPVRQVFFPSVR